MAHTDFEDPVRAGNGMLNLALSDFEEGVRDASKIIEANRGVRLFSDR